ncbi:MAG: flagellar motor switch protein FliG [Paracoccaceae bacterium]
MATRIASLPGPASGGHTLTAAARLTRKQKAAIIVRLLLAEGADIPLSDLPEDLQADLTQQMGAMRYVDRATLAEVVQEFAQELDSIGLAFPGGIAGALSILDGRISPQTAARLRREAGVRQAGDPWARLRALPVDELLPFALDESVEVAAVLLAKLDVAQAAELLGKLPGDRARRITYAVSLTGAVTPEAVDRIGLALAAQLDTRAPRAFAEEPVKRLGAILDSSAASTREDLLEGLEQTDIDFAARVRKAIFTFADIPARLAPLDVPRVLRELDQDMLVRALAAAMQMGQQDAAEYLLSNVSRRMADTLRESMSETGPIRTREGEAALTEVVRAIRSLADRGEITLQTPEDDPDEA